MSIAEFDGAPSWSLDASETEESTLSLCFSICLNYYFQVSFNAMVISYVFTKTQETGSGIDTRSRAFARATRQFAKIIYTTVLQSSYYSCRAW